MTGSGDESFGCADAMVATGGRSPLAKARRFGVRQAGFDAEAWRRAPHRASGPRPAILASYGGMPVSVWGWLRHREPNVSGCYGRPTVVRPGDVLQVDATEQHSGMLFLALMELHPGWEEFALQFKGYELTSDMRVKGVRELYLRHDVEAQTPDAAEMRRLGFDDDDYEGPGDDQDEDHGERDEAEEDADEDDENDQDKEADADDIRFLLMVAAWRRKHRELLIAKAEAFALTKPFRPPRPRPTAAEIRALAESRPGPRTYTIQPRRKPARIVRRQRR